MRLDELLTSSLDVSTVVTQHLGVHALLRLGLVSKGLLSCIKQDGILYTSFLKTFPTLRQLPSGKPSSYYLEAIWFYYYGPSLIFYNGHIPKEMTVEYINDILSSNIRCCSCWDHESDERIKRLVRLTCISFEFKHPFSRKRILNCVGECKKTLVDRCENSEHIYNVSRILDGVATVAESTFVFREIGSEHGYISI